MTPDIIPEQEAIPHSNLGPIAARLTHRFARRWWTKVTTFSATLLAQSCTLEVSELCRDLGGIILWVPRLSYKRQPFLSIFDLYADVAIPRRPRVVRAGRE